MTAFRNFQKSKRANLLGELTKEKFDLVIGIVI